MTTAYPLQWPPGWPRTAPDKRERSRFDTTVHRALGFIEEEVRRLGAKALVISSNYTLGPSPEDVGVCAYFEFDGLQAAMPCDRWMRVEDNLHSIAKTIEAMRGIERWGAKNMIKAAFTGFVALPAPASRRPWRDVLGVKDVGAGAAELVEASYKRLRSRHHPDKGGTAERFNEVQLAYDQARAEIGMP